MYTSLKHTLHIRNCVSFRYTKDTCFFDSVYDSSSSKLHASFKHICHFSYILNIPIGKISVKMCTSLKHKSHIRNCVSSRYTKNTCCFGSVVVYSSSSKRLASQKHICHFSYILNIPIGKISVKICTTCKHTSHIRNFVSFPFIISRYTKNTFSCKRYTTWNK